MPTTSAPARLHDHCAQLALQGRKGEVDLIGWDRKILCFIE